MCAKRRSNFISYGEIESLGESELRKVYREYQSIFRKRIDRLAKAGYERLVKPYQKGGFNYIPPISARKTQGMTEAENTRALRMGVRELVTLLTGGESASVGLSLSAIKGTQKQIDNKIRESLAAGGLQHISTGMVKKFGRFMDAMRQEYGKKLPNSDLMAMFFDSLKYKAKRMSVDKLVDLWQEYERGGYAASGDNVDLFRT